MRHSRVGSSWLCALLLAAAGGLHGQALVSLGASSGSGSGCALSGGGTCTLSARVTGITPATVTFDFSPRVAGDNIGAPNGPNSSGLTTIAYTAPNPVLARQTITVTATAVDGSKAQTLITLVPPTATVSLNPSATVTLAGGQTQHFTATVLGVSQTGVTWTLSPQIGTLSVNGNAADYTAPNPIPSTQTIKITATSTFDPTVSASGTVQLNVSSVTVAPATASLTNSQQVQFTATVTNGASNNVTWSITPSVGSIDQTGLYTAPGTLTAVTKVTVTATSVSDPTKSGTAAVTVTPLISIGDGAPTQTMQFVFQTVFRRNDFVSVVVLPPIGLVKAFGTGGYVQEFTDAADSTTKDAIVTGAASVGGLNTAFQIRAPLYSYYASTSANTAGYPLGDSQSCTAQGVACQWDTFDKNYALFAYASALPNGFGPNFAVNAAFYTEWTAGGGGINGLGSPVSSTSSITAAVIAPATAGTTASAQLFAKGAIYSITSGPNRGKVFSVLQPLYTLYAAQSGPTGTLGLPVSEIYQLSATVYKQNFEGGALQYTVGSDPGVVLPVASVRVSLGNSQAGGTVALALGQSVTLTATPMLATGEAASDRPVSWLTTSGKVLAIAANGGSAVITAIGAGAASVQASSQGVASSKINFVVTAPCCAIGDGAPPSVQQAFRDALTRNQISVQTPLAAPAARVGNGYVQMASAADSSATYLLAQSDKLGSAYVVGGAILARYLALAGAAGQLGYPASDVSAGGTQLFANGALGGTPVRLVTGPVLAKWALLGYESGAAGPPASEASAFDSPGANEGQQQSFSKGLIVAAVTGPRAGQGYFVSGLILTRYSALGGPSGDFGMPTTDEFATGGLRQQNFEGGTVTYAAGDAAAVEHVAPRSPGVIVFPAAVSAGARARLAVVGFADNSTLRVSLTGSPDFIVTAANGAYSWDMAIPLSAKSGTIAIHAADGKGAAADGSLAVRGFADNRIQMAKAQGDNQTGLPGALLPVRLRVALADSSNVPVAGVPVTFTASAGVQLSTASAVTNADGLAEAAVRLPSADGIAAITASAAGVAQAPITFYARVAGSTLTNVPKMTMSGDAPLGRGSATIAQKGALLTSIATILRYHQNRGELTASNGPADPATLNQFLTDYCSVDVNGAQVCDGYFGSGSGSEQVANLWRAADFTGGVDIVVQNPTVAAVADTIANGSPALLSLALTANGAPAGGHFVVATGVASDGSIVIQDPSPYFGRASLTDYLRGFTSGGTAWAGELRGVVQFALRSPSATRFLVGAVSQSAAVLKTLTIDVQSPNGVCGTPIDLLDSVDGAGNAPGGAGSRFLACDGAASSYQISVGAAQAYHAFVADLATAGATVDISAGSVATYRAARLKLNLTLSPQTASFTADAVVNAATFAAGAAPGGIVSIFGAGLSGPGTATVVDFDGTPGTVLLMSPFQVNVVVPAELAPGTHQVRVRSAFGTAEQTIPVSAVAPGIFTLGSPDAGAVLNPEYSINSPTTPVARGQYLAIYATGLGAVSLQGSLSVVTTPVTVVLGTQEVPATFAGLAPGFAGLYQVNVVIPAAIPPGLSVPLTLKQGSQVGNRVIASIQ